MKLEHLLTPHTRITSKWIKDLNIRLKNKILEENISSKISGISYCNIFSDMFSWAREINKKKQMRLHQTKKF